MRSSFKTGLILGMMLTGAAPLATAQTPAQVGTVRTPDAESHRAVVQVGTIKSRETAGKINRFIDAGQREFAVSYDSDGRPVSVMATKQRHIADVLSVGYDESGNVRAVSLGNGEQLYYSPIDGGGRVVRDAGGNLVILSSAGDVIRSDESGKLAATVLRMENLFKTLQ